MYGFRISHAGNVTVWVLQDRWLGKHAMTKQFSPHQQTHIYVFSISKTQQVTACSTKLSDMQ